MSYDSNIIEINPKDMEEDESLRDDRRGSAPNISDRRKSINEIGWKSVGGIKGIDKYHILECVGRGTFGTIYRATRISDGKVVAVKCIDVQRIRRQNLSTKTVLNEIYIMKILSNCPGYEEYVVEYYDSFRQYWRYKTSIPRDTIFIVMEYLDGGTMDKCLDNNVTIEDLWDVMKSVVKSISYIHSCNIAHRDIKPQNIMLQRLTKSYKLIDFGLSCYDDNDYNPLSGSPSYMPPELFKKNVDGDLKAAQAHDIWCERVIFYQLANNKHPMGHISTYLDIIDTRAPNSVYIYEHGSIHKLNAPDRLSKSSGDIGAQGEDYRRIIVRKSNSIISLNNSKSKYTKKTLDYLIDWMLTVVWYRRPTADTIERYMDAEDSGYETTDGYIINRRKAIKKLRENNIPHDPNDCLSDLPKTSYGDRSRWSNVLKKLFNINN